MMMPAKSKESEYYRYLGIYRKSMRTTGLGEEAKDWLIKQMYVASIKEKLDLVGPMLKVEAKDK